MSADEKGRPFGRPFRPIAAGLLQQRVDLVEHPLRLRADIGRLIVRHLQAAEIQQCP